MKKQIIFTGRGVCEQKPKKRKFKHVANSNQLSSNKRR